MIILNKLSGLRPKLSVDEKNVRQAMRAVTAERIKVGEIKQTPCKVCGDLKVDAHHISYNNPKVVFLCRKHHADWHGLQAIFLRLRTTYGMKFVRQPQRFSFSWVWVKNHMDYRPRPAQRHPSVIRRGQKVIRIL